MLFANLSRQKRINLGLITFCVLLLFFHNCGNVNISQKPYLESQSNGNNGNNGGNGPVGNNPPVAAATKVTDLYFCESYIVSGHLRYYVHPFNLSNQNFAQKYETGNCVGHLFFDTTGDGRDEFVHNYTNSSVHDCKLETYNTTNSQLQFSKPLPGLITYSDNPIRICNGISWDVKDQNNDGKRDLYYIYRINGPNNNTPIEKLVILDPTTGQEITSANAPSTNFALINTQINDVNNDGLEDFIGFVPGTGDQTVVRDVKIAIYDARAIWGMPLKTHTLANNNSFYQAKYLKNKNGSPKYAVSTQRLVLNSQTNSLTGVEVTISLHDSNLSKTHSFTNPNAISANGNNSTVIDSVGDFTGDGQDDLVAVLYDSQNGKYTSYILDGQNLNLIQEFSGAWISQKLGRPVTNFYRTIGFAQADNDEALELFLLVWETNKISVIAIKNNGQVVVDKTSPSEWLSDVYQIRSPL